MVYIKYTNGSTTLLINMYDEVKQNEAIESGFYMERDEDGSPAIVESDKLTAGKSKSQKEVIDSINEKLGKKSDANKKAIEHKKEKSNDEIIKGLV